MEIEKRKLQRYKIRKKDVMIFHDGNVGQIKNLSVEGCSCNCMVTNTKFSHSNKLSIFYSYRGDSLIVKNIPYTIVHNCLNEILPYTSTITRNCSIKFEDISSSQKEKIELLISHLEET